MVDVQFGLRQARDEGGQISHEPRLSADVHRFIGRGPRGDVDLERGDHDIAHDRSTRLVPTARCPAVPSSSHCSAPSGPVIVTRAPFSR